jgi:hypothetical protein
MVSDDRRMATAAATPPPAGLPTLPAVLLEASLPRPRAESKSLTKLSRLLLFLNLFAATATEMPDRRGDRGGETNGVAAAASAALAAAAAAISAISSEDGANYDEGCFVFEI